MTGKTSNDFKNKTDVSVTPHEGINALQDRTTSQQLKMAKTKGFVNVTGDIMEH